MDRINTEEVMDKLDMSQSRFGKIHEFGCRDLEIISSDVGTQFTSIEFQDKFQNQGVRFMFAYPKHQEMNGQCEVTWRILRTISHSRMVHARVLEAYIHLALMYTADNISRYYQSNTL